MSAKRQRRFASSINDRFADIIRALGDATPAKTMP
jgi:hypothetical protein